MQASCLTSFWEGGGRKKIEERKVEHDDGNWKKFYYFLYGGTANTGREGVERVSIFGRKRREKKRGERLLLVATSRKTVEEREPSGFFEKRGEGAPLGRRLRGGVSPHPHLTKRKRGTGKKKMGGGTLLEKGRKGRESSAPLPINNYISSRGKTDRARDDSPPFWRTARGKKRGKRKKRGLVLFAPKKNTWY